MWSTDWWINRAKALELLDAALTQQLEKALAND
ncbi:hypothetical protein ACT3UM_20190 [Halomonas sp. AOP13-D3-9]